MKKLLIFAAVATVVLAACSKIENDPIVVDQQINFVVATQMASTKAATAYADSLDFGSYAFYADGDAGKTAGTAMYSNEQVTFQSSYWSTANNKYYWPKKGTLTFLAYAPYTVDDASLTPSVTSSNMIWTSAKVYEYNTDILYAKKAIQKTNSNDTDSLSTGHDKGVTTIFQHAASQVEIAVVPAYTADADSTTTWEIVLKEFSIAAVNTVGTCTVTSNGVNSDWTSIAWSAQSTPETIASFNGSETLNSKTVQSTQIMVPQTLGDDVIVSAKVDIVTYRNGSEFNKVSNYVFSGKLNNAVIGTTTTKVTEWEAGKSYKYVIKLTPADSRDNDGNPTDQVNDALIKFDPIVNGWTEVTCNLAM